jgi:hypothetical protein
MMEKDPKWGEWVRVKDYAALEAENAKLKAENARLTQTLGFAAADCEGCPRE